MTSYVEVEYESIERETDSAFLVVFEDGQEEWIPKSTVEDHQRDGLDEYGGTLCIAEWIAIDRELDYH